MILFTGEGVPTTGGGLVLGGVPALGGLVPGWGVPVPGGVWSWRCLLQGGLVLGVSRPIPKGEVEGDQVQAHTQAGN